MRVQGVGRDQIDSVGRIPLAHDQLDHSCLADLGLSYEAMDDQANMDGGGSRRWVGSAPFYNVVNKLFAATLDVSA